MRGPLICPLVRKRKGWIVGIHKNILVHHFHIIVMLEFYWRQMRISLLSRFFYQFRSVKRVHEIQ